MAAAPPVAARAPALALLRSAAARHGAVLGAAMLAAGALDYAVSVVAGRWLEPVEFGAFVAVGAVLQVLLSVATAIRMVVAYHAAALAATHAPPAALAAFLRGTARWSVRWGLAAAALAAAASPPLAAALRLPGPAPLLAASAMVGMLFVREATLGALQGVQAFGGLGLVQASQAALRLVLSAGLVLAGGGAAGAVLGQPLAAVAAVLVGIGFLAPRARAGGTAAAPAVSRAYSAWTVAALALFGLLTNLDALFVKLAFDPRTAGDYAPVVTFEKMSLFLPWAISFVLFPKATGRTAAGRDPRPILRLALVAALAPGLLMTACFAAAPGEIVRAVFGAAYADPGPLLALGSLTGTLHAGGNIWLNYALSTGRVRYVPILLAVVAAEAAGMALLGRERLLDMALVAAGAALLANVGGWAVAFGPPEGARR
jgi:O-antigen/teichoic acid export membrane protein